MKEIMRQTKEEIAEELRRFFEVGLILKTIIGHYDIKDPEVALRRLLDSWHKGLSDYWFSPDKPEGISLYDFQVQVVIRLRKMYGEIGTRFIPDENGKLQPIV